MCFWGVSGSGQNPGSQAKPLGKNITSTTPGAEKDRKATALSGTKQNGHFRRQSSIDFGAGMVHLKPEWPIFGTGKGQKSTHRKIVKHSPCFKG
jgi:hypothetical protein